LKEVAVILLGLGSFKGLLVTCVDLGFAFGHRIVWTRHVSRQAPLRLPSLQRLSFCQPCGQRDVFRSQSPPRGMPPFSASCYKRKMKWKSEGLGDHHRVGCSAWIGAGLPRVHVQECTDGCKRAFSRVVGTDHSRRYIFFPCAFITVSKPTSCNLQVVCHRTCKGFVNAFPE
jgi:hypothetical protein